MEESADSNPGKSDISKPSSRRWQLAGAPRTKSADGARTRPACGKGRSELGIGELRQAGPAEWAAKQLMGQPAPVKRWKRHRSQGSQAGPKA